MTAVDAPSAIDLHNLTLGYDRHPAVHHLDARLSAGSLTAVVGPNGGGKTTLLRGIAGILRPLEGRVTLGADARRGIAYLPQRANLDRAFPLTVFDLVAMGLWPRIGAFGPVSRTMRGRVQAALRRVGLDGVGHRAIGALSGGQLQRALFARVLLQDAPVLLLDEPFAAVEEEGVEGLMRLILGWHAEGRTVVAVLHDLDQVRSSFPDTLLLARELVAHGATGRVLTAANLAVARGRHTAFDEAAAACRHRPLQEAA